jgi:hypothetical protein
MDFQHTKSAVQFPFKNLDLILLNFQEQNCSIFDNSCNIGLNYLNIVKPSQYTLLMVSNGTKST